MLLEAGHSVRCIGRSKPPAAWASKVEFIQADLKDREAVKGAIGNIDALMHLAGLVSVKNGDGRKMYELHVDATRELLKEIISSGQKPRVVLVSTSGTIASRRPSAWAPKPTTTQSRPSAGWPYCMSMIYEEKLTLELCKKHGLPLVVLNPSLLMGPGDDRLSST